MMSIQNPGVIAGRDPIVSQLQTTVKYFSLLDSVFGPSSLPLPSVFSLSKPIAPASISAERYYSSFS